MFFQQIKKGQRLGRSPIANSPKEVKLIERYDINFKKSPQKYALYESPQHPQYLSNRDLQPFTSNGSDFDKVKKVPSETAALRQTMGHKFMNRLQKNNAFDVQYEKGNKLNDFLRQTMSYNTGKPYSDSLIPDYAYSGEVYSQDREQHRNTNYQGLRFQQRKGAGHVNDNASLKEYEMLNDKINRNKQLIDELRNMNKPKDVKDLLKNVNQHHSPTFLQLDNKKQKDGLFLKPKKEEHNYYLTPKVDKGNYETRFNSSPLIEQNKSKDKNNEEQTIASLTSIASAKRKPSTTSVLPNKGITCDEFIHDKKLGQGKFGCVTLVRHKKTNGLFALKKIPKALIKANLMIEQLALEIRIQSCIRHANLLEIYGFFDDKTHLYIVLEYMSGGTLYQRLKKDKIKENEVSTIIRQITSGIEYLHDLGIAHRDLKPENIVISNDVYKLCDFGWAAICTERRKTYCGTFDYVAPQILQGVQYDMTVDLWCLGVLTYELLTGKAPFYHISRKETMKKILNVENETLIFPEGMSEDAKDFIDKLIRKNPEERIKASEALRHPFLKEIEDDS